MYSADELLQWLQNWIYSNYKKNPRNKTRVQIMTIDNPGWGVTIDRISHLPNKNLPLADATNSEDNWYYCTIKDSKFEGDGGLFNLADIFRIFKQLVNYDDTKNYFIKSQKIRINDDLTWLLQWFVNQCDGDWEHGNGIKIGTIDNPGWHLKVSLYDTELEKKDFQIVDISRAEHDWIYCAIKDAQFQGFGGLYNLPEILSTFRNWAES